MFEHSGTCFLSFFFYCFSFFLFSTTQNLKHSQRVIDFVLNRNIVSLTLLHTFPYKFVSSFKLVFFFGHFCIFFFFVCLFWNKHYEYIYDAVTQLLTSCNNKEK